MKISFDFILTFSSFILTNFLPFFCLSYVYACLLAIFILFIFCLLAFVSHLHFLSLKDFFFFIMKRKFLLYLLSEIPTIIWKLQVMKYLALMWTQDSRPFRAACCFFRLIVREIQLTATDYQKDGSHPTKNYVWLLKSSEPPKRLCHE